MGYFGRQLARLCKNLVLRLRHLYRVPRTVTMVANRPVLFFPGRKMSHILREAKVNFFDAMLHQFNIKFHPETLKLRPMCMGREH